MVVLSQTMEKNIWREIYNNYAIVSLPESLHPHKTTSLLLRVRAEVL